MLYPLLNTTVCTKSKLSCRLSFLLKVEVHINPSAPPSFLLSDLKPEHLEHLKVNCSFQLHVILATWFLLWWYVRKMLHFLYCLAALVFLPPQLPNVLLSFFAAMHGETFWWLPTSTWFEQYPDRPRSLHLHLHIVFHSDMYKTYWITLYSKYAIVASLHHRKCFYERSLKSVIQVRSIHHVHFFFPMTDLVSQNIEVILNRKTNMEAVIKIIEENIPEVISLMIYILVVHNVL